MSNSKTNPFAPKSRRNTAPETGEKTVDTSESVQVPTGTVKEILAWVGDDSDRAIAALEVETSGSERTSLIKALEEVINES